MEGKYKIVRFHASIYFNTAYICANYSCPTGWNPLPAPGAQCLCVCVCVCVCVCE